MEILGEFFEQDADGNNVDGTQTLYKVRKAARAVVFNREGEIALMFVSDSNYHKLPGGGVRQDENLETALKREVMKDAGCDINVKRNVGVIIEYRISRCLLQISYCFIADVENNPKESSFAGKEEKRELELEWMDLDEAIEILGKENPEDYVAQFIRKRDLLFLQKAKKILNL